MHLHDVLSSWPEGFETQEVIWSDWTEDYIEVEYTDVLTINRVINLIEYLEGKLRRFSDMSSNLNLQLQDAMNKQQQAMQILSNIMKTQHDTLKAIIQNMR